MLWENTYWSSLGCFFSFFSFFLWVAGGVGGRGVEVVVHNPSNKQTTKPTQQDEIQPQSGLKVGALTLSHAVIIAQVGHSYRQYLPWLLSWVLTHFPVYRENISVSRKNKKASLTSKTRYEASCEMLTVAPLSSPPHLASSSFWASHLSNQTVEKSRHVLCTGFN